MGPAPVGPRASSFAPCNLCQFGEACSPVSDLPPCLEPPCDEQPGDDRCHQICNDGQCAHGEHCETHVYHIDDTGAHSWKLCVCDSPPCPELGSAEYPLVPEGGIEFWRNEGLCPLPLFDHAATATATRLIVSGGRMGDPGTGYATTIQLQEVFGAQLLADGRLGAWQELGQLPSPLSDHATAVLGDRLYVAGGYENGWSSAVYSAALDEDGTLGAWREEASLPQPTAYHELLTDGERLLAAGGLTSPASDGPHDLVSTDELLLAQPDAEGGIRDWRTIAPPFTDGEWVIAAGRLYGEDADARVYSAALDELEAGAWRAETGPGSATVSSLYSGALRGPWVGVCDALLMVLDDGLAMTAPVGAGGVLGEWRPATRFHGRRHGYALAASPNGHAYVTGGTDSALPLEQTAEVWSTERL
jgi:hypothetical protein